MEKFAACKPKKSILLEGEVLKCFYILTHFFAMHTFSTPLKTSENVEKGCIRKKWVNSEKLATL